MTTSVLIVEDEPSILELISYTCRTSGMEVRKAANVAEAKKNLEAAKPDIILLDWMLPDCAGLEWLYELRRYHSNESLPVIMLTARGQEDDRVRGLEAGADDYVTKPFSNRELQARVKALLRRSEFAADPQLENDADTEIVIGDLHILPDAFLVQKGNKELDLTHREFELLYHLATHVGQVMTREHLLETVWGYDYFGDVRTVDVTVRRLREKIEDTPGRPEYILTRRGVGYYMRNND